MFKDIKKKITEAGQNAVTQTRKLAETAELNAKINKRQGDLNKEMLELGKKFYISKKNSIPKAFTEQFEAINTIREDITQMKQRLSELKEKTETDIETESVVVPQETSELAKETPAKKTAPKKPAADNKPTPKAPVAKKPAPKKPAAKAAEAKKPTPKKPAANKEVTIPVFEASGRNCTNCGKPLGDDETTCPACGTENPVK